MNTRLSFLALTRSVRALTLFSLLTSCVADTHGASDGDPAGADDDDVGRATQALFSGNGSVAATTTVFEEQSTENAGGYSGFCVGNLSAATATRHGYIRYNLPVIPATATITRVQVSFEQNRVAKPEVTATLRMHRVTGAAWTEGTGTGGSLACAGGAAPADGVTFATTPTVSGTLGGDASLPQCGTVAASSSVNCTTGSTVTVTMDSNAGDTGLIADVQGWVTSGSNFGWRLTLSNDNVSTARYIVPGTLTVTWTLGSGGLCDADDDCTSGACVLTASGADCGGSSPCLCCNSATCTGACQTCASGTCGLRPNGTACAAQSCSGSTLTAAATCSGMAGCPAGATSSCSPYVCSGASCRTNCTLDAHCTSGNYCSGGVCTDQASNGAVCTADNQCETGNCRDGRCCNSTCTGQCQACDIGGSLGTCTTVSSGPPHGTRTACASDGSACAGTCNGSSATMCAFPGAGTNCRAQSCTLAVLTQPAQCAGTGSCPALMTTSCSPYQCNGTSCRTSCSSDTHCVTGSFCSGTTCVPLQALGTVCTAGGQCSSGNCVDGRCCNGACSGQCQACNASGLCLAVTGAPQGGRAACATDGSACGGACNGTLTTACTFPGAGTGCRNASCTAGIGTLAAVCQGNGSCGALQTQDCSPYLCSGDACSGTGCVTNAECAIGFFCNGASACQPTLADGVACSTGAQCTSGECVDGVCCNVACGGQCEACNVSGSVGTCSPVTGAPVGARAACATDGSACAGSCGGVNRLACTFPGAATACRGASCTAGVATEAATCAGAGACAPVATVTCAPYRCDGTVCDAVCASTSECVAGNYCNAGSRCVPLLASGAMCTTAEQCSSSLCVDGRCCNSACTGQCEACDVGASPGVCTPVAGAPHGARPVCDSDGSACGGTCNGTARAACTYPGSATPCRSESCSTEVLTEAASCAGAGSCGPLVRTPCSPFRCSGASCGTSCVTDANCVTGSFCNSANLCEGTLTIGDTCDTDGQCVSGNCADGVCCNMACDGQCEACDASGSVGSCVAISGAPHGSRAACTDDGSACGGSCDGSARASCAYPPSSTACRAASCAAGTATLAATCDAAGSCGTLATQACAPFLCAATACSTTCATDGDCAPGGFCEPDGTCRGANDLGTPCVNGAECASALCVDGVCCDSDCTGQCASCSVPGRAGTCSPIPGNPRGGRPACETDGTACRGLCDGTNADTCAYPGAATECRAASCRSGTATERSVCQGDGTCPDGVEVDCGAPCDGDVCGTPTVDAGEPVDAGTPEADAATGEMDSGVSADAGPDVMDGGCTCRVGAARGRSGGAGLWLVALAIALSGVRRRRG